MNKLTSLAMLPALLAVAFASAQSAKLHPPQPSAQPGQGHHGLRAGVRPAVPLAANPFGLPKAAFQPIPALAPAATGPEALRITRAANGLPIFFEGLTEASGDASDTRPAGEQAMQYLASLPLEGLVDPGGEFVAKTAATDEQGNRHVRFQQTFQGVPVYGGEMIAHSRKGAFLSANGRYFPTPQLGTVVPAVSQEAALQVVAGQIGQVKTDWTAQELAMLGGAAFTAELVVYHEKNRLDAERLAWYVEGHPDFLTRVVYFVDAQTGAVIHAYDHTCRIDGGRLHRHGDTAHPDASAVQPANSDAFATAPGAEMPPPVTASGLDLLNVNRTFGAWQQGGTVFLEDASKSMFNASASQMPGSPVGAIVTLTGFNNSPQNSNFDYDLVSSTSTVFNNKTAVSAHYNGGKSFDYYQATFGRNSIDGVGGNILAFVNITEPDGSSMDNAFWNGAAMFYGEGGSSFKPLARGLDVAGHEMTHGVVEKTANLEYQDESGALNESFADVFGVMIDRDDWQIGEDVMQAGASPSGALRDLQNPHNGDVTNGDFWQPQHVNEQFVGSFDNGGVHINSGIPNRAFYLFASNAAVGKDKAEQVYYKALRDYLVKSSQFIDARLAVIQAANDLYGSTVANAAASAFTTVGIVGNEPGGNYLGTLSPNPGDDYVLVVSNDNSVLQLADGNGTLLGTMYPGGVNSRPSVTDNGSSVVFVNGEGHIVLIDVSYVGGNISIQQTILSQQPEWRNAVISKDGRFIAGVTIAAEDRIYIFDLFLSDDETFYLYNPTYTQGQITGEVQYADVLEFDYSGTYLMYDAFNELTGSNGTDLSYWDIGFLEFFNNEANGGLGEFVDGGNAYISKLFSGIPENTSIGNPTFAKNSPYVIAFDFIDHYNDRYDVYGSNTETGDYDIIVTDNGDLGWPSFNRLDNAIIYQEPGYNIFRQGLAASKISAQGNASSFVGNRQWGVWYASGNRSLMVDADEPAARAMALTAAPNPVAETLRLSFVADGRLPSARLSVLNLLGETLLDRDIAVAAGANQAELDLRGWPAGAYVARLAAGSTVATVKVVKQ